MSKLESQTVPSSFGWVDFSEQDRHKMLEIIRSFREPDTLDELGIGPVRDALADLMFPGTSTIQTRAKYILFIPCIYRRHEDRKTPSHEIRGKVRRDEEALVRALLRSDDLEGVIGRRLKALPVRAPSSIYWNGLRTWGILRFPGSQDQYHRYLNTYYAINKRQIRGDDGELILDTVACNWDPGIPSMESDFPNKANLALSKAQASYLQERMMMSCSGTLLAHLVDHTKPTRGVPFVWMHPDLSKFPTSLKTQIEHARCFSEIIRGSALLYNLLLAEKCGHTEWIEHYRHTIEDWTAAIEGRWQQLEDWDVTEFWEVVQSSWRRIPARAQRFISEWIRLVMTSDDLRDLADRSMARDLVCRREFELKHARARLVNTRALELWNGASGTAQLDYRWNVVARLLNDILTGLKSKEASDA
ncbi:MAG: DUF6361 family protein [Armatimonadota bacterium]